MHLSEVSLPMPWTYKRKEQVKVGLNFDRKAHALKGMVKGLISRNLKFERLT